MERPTLYPQKIKRIRFTSQAWPSSVEGPFSVFRIMLLVPGIFLSSLHPWKFNMTSPLKNYHPKRKALSSIPIIFQGRAVILRGCSQSWCGFCVCFFLVGTAHLFIRHLNHPRHSMYDMFTVYLYMCLFFNS